MTRVNVGIEPAELCDQMLLAELRELPRCYKHRTNAGPDQFTLGTGHVLWCSRYQLSLESRHYQLWKESVHRGFRVAYHPPLLAQTGPVYQWSHADEATARPLLIARIRERLSQMKRKPTWTDRQPPTWSTT